MVLGLTGAMHSTFGEVRRRALETAARARTANPGVADGQHDSRDMTEDGQMDMPQTAPADGASRDE